MVRLHLIGFTTDLKSLIFANRRGAKRGGYIVEIDKRLLGALEEVARLETEGKVGAQETAPEPQPEAAPASAARQSALSPKEIQTLLREGKSEEQVAKLAQADVSWIQRFTGPIIAERAGVIDSVRAASIAKRRLGPSSVSVGQAVQQNLAEKRIRMDPEIFEKSWKATRRGRRWHVAFQYSSRGRRRVARFVFDPETRGVSAVNDVALDVGWRSNNMKRPRRTPAPANATRRAKAAPAGARGGRASTPSSAKPAAKRARGASVKARDAAAAKGRGTAKASRAG